MAEEEHQTVIHCAGTLLRRREDEESDEPTKVSGRGGTKALMHQARLSAGTRSIVHHGDQIRGVMMGRPPITPPLHPAPR